MPSRLSVAASALVASFIVLVALAGCTAQQPDVALSKTAMPVPTVASMFEPPQVTLAPPPEAIPTPILSARTAVPNAQQPPRGMEDLLTVPVYTDQISSGWTVQPSSNIVCNTAQQGYTYRGQYAIMCMPSGDDAKLFFALEPTTRQTFLRERVVAVSFYLSGDNIAIGTDQLGVSVQGSVANSYWVADDTSAKPKGRDTAQADMPLFAETPLYYLGVNRAIQPGEWSQVVLWLDNQIYDPDYTYVVGFYLKTDQALVPRFYVDQVSLLLSK
jgi:hypothetical protein